MYLYIYLYTTYSLCLSHPVIIDGQAQAWPFSVFTPKQVFPRTAKCQPISIKFCTHLLLYGIHLWADLDRDRRGKIPEFFSVGGARSKTAFFSHFRVPFDYPAHSLQEAVLPQTKPMVPMEIRDSEGVLIAIVWRVCEYAFGRYRPRRVPKGGQVTITKIENLHIDKCRKIH